MRALLSSDFAPVLTSGLDRHQLSVDCQICSPSRPVTHPLKVPSHTWTLELIFVETPAGASLPCFPATQTPPAPRPRGCQVGKQAEGPRHCSSVVPCPAGVGGSTQGQQAPFPSHLLPKGWTHFLRPSWALPAPARWGQAGLQAAWHRLWPAAEKAARGLCPFPRTSWFPVWALRETDGVLS